MMIAIFALTGVLYATACAVYLVFLSKGRATVGSWASRVLWAAVASHAAFLLLGFLLEDHAPIGNIREALSVSSLLIVIAFLVVCVWKPITVLGGFITPVTLLFFLGAGLGDSVANVPVHVRSTLLPFHIGANVLGFVAFTLAFAVELGYLVQESLLRRKKLRGLFQRLPALDVLDRMGFRLVSVGFPLLTIGIVSGAFFARQLGETTTVLSGTTGFALLAWVIFAGVLLLRVAAGWRGRRAAIGTISGFVCATVVLLGYFLRAVGGSP